MIFKKLNIFVFVLVGLMAMSFTSVSYAQNSAEKVTCQEVDNCQHAEPDDHCINCHFHGGTSHLHHANLVASESFSLCEHTKEVMISHAPFNQFLLISKDIKPPRA